MLTDELNGWMIDAEGEANIGQHIVTCDFPLQQSLAESSESPAAARQICHNMKMSGKADDFRKIFRYYHEFYGNKLFLQLSAESQRHNSGK